MLTALPGADSSSVSADPPDAAMLPPDVASMFTQRIGAVGLIALLGTIGFAAPFLIGLWVGVIAYSTSPSATGRC